MDFTSTGVEVLPPDPESPPLEASPVLLVATSDEVLRFFTFGHLSKFTKGLVAAPLPLKEIQPRLATPEQKVGIS